MNHEGEIVASSGRIVCCEIKSRSEETIPSQGILWNTIEHARKQLPKGKPAIVLIKIPERWVKQRDIQTVVEAAIEKVFRQSHRITAVVFTWDEWYSAPQDSELVVSRVRPYPNMRSNMYQDDIDAILSGIGRAGNPGWVCFHRLALQVRGAA